MVEIPSAAILTSEILAEVDFVSVGTNDLLQYMAGAPIGITGGFFLL